MRYIFKSNSKIFYGIIVISIMLLSLSYGVFVLSSNKYKVSELMVGNLLYGITIHDTDNQELTNPLIVGEGETVVYVTIYSVNSISSKYTLGYDNNNVSVSASSRSGWNASGSMSTYNNYAYAKTVKVVVTNNSGSNQNVTFAAFGGYSYNSTSNIPLGNGYYTVANFIDVINASSKLLTTIVEEDTNCNSDNCLYGGEATTNYFQFEDNGDLYRVLGTYTIDNDKITKIAANTLSETTAPSNLSNVLNEIENEVDTRYVYETNKFNCTGTTSLSCNSSNYEDIGILSLDEYRQLEGDSNNSYLYNSNSYYLLNGSSLVSNTNQSVEPSTAYVRPTMYLESDTQVEGSGTIENPYILEKIDIKMIAFTYNGNSINDATSYINELGTTYDADVTCTNETTAYINDDGQLQFDNLVLPTQCTVDFVDMSSKHTLTYSKTGNGSLSKFTGKISTNGTTTIKVNPDVDNFLISATCSDGYTTNASIGSSTTGPQTITITNSNTNSDGTCTFGFGYLGQLMYLCPDGTYQDSSSCVGTMVSYTRSYSKTCTTYYTSCPGTGASQGPVRCDYNTTSASVTYCHTFCSNLGVQYMNSSAGSFCVCTRPSYNSYGSLSTSDSGTTTCVDGYDKGVETPNQTCSAPSGSCTSAWSCSQTITASCTATGTLKYYCSTTDTYQINQECYY